MNLGFRYIIIKKEKYCSHLRKVIAYEIKCGLEDPPKYIQYNFFSVILSLICYKKIVLKVPTSFSRRWRCCPILIQAKALLLLNDQSQNGSPQKLWKFPFGNENLVVIDSTDNRFFVWCYIVHSSGLIKDAPLPVCLLRNLTIFPFTAQNL